MKNFNELKFTPELMTKIEACRSADELVKCAADNGIELSRSDAENYFKKVPMMKLNDDELDKVAGGAIQRQEFTIQEKSNNK